MSDDVVAIKGVKGIGLKTAQKIIIELKDKIKGYADDGDSSSPAGSAAIQAKQEAVAALVMMDCAQAAAEKVVSAILKTTPNATVVQLIKEALAQLKRV